MALEEANLNELKSNFPKVYNAYTRAKNEFEPLKDSPLNPNGWIFPEIEVDLKYKGLPTLDFNKNKFIISGPSALKMPENDIYIYIYIRNGKLVSQFSKCF